MVEETKQSAPEPYLDEDEINLLDYVIVLLKHKWLIIGIVLLTGVVAVITSLQLTNIYRSEATIVAREEEKSTASSALSALGGLGSMTKGLVGLGGAGSLEKFEVVLTSREVARSIVDKHELMPRLFEELWNPEKEKWTEQPPPTFQDAYGALMDMLTVDIDDKKGVITIKFDHEKPQFAKEMVEYYLTELSESLRKETLQDARENQKFLRRQLENTSDVLLREKIYSMLAREIEKETFARAQNYYAFQVLDPPIVPDLDKKVRPKRKLICILSVTVAGFFAIFLAFLLEYIQNVRNSEDQETLKKLRTYLRLPPGRR